MKQRLNPIHKNGDRNLFCFHYTKCLDHAAKRHWKYWSCYACSHKATRQPVVTGPITSDENILYYNLPQDIYQKVI